MSDFLTNPIPWPYRVLAIGLLSISLLAYGYFRGTEHGSEQVQTKWDAQKLVDSEENNKRLAAAVARTQQHAIDQAFITDGLYERKQNEKTDLAITLAAIHNDTSQLRTITGKAIRQSEEPTSETGAITTGTADQELCTVQLPAEIGAGFRRLQETLIQLASEANDKDDQLRAAIEILELDRRTCN